MRKVCRLEITSLKLATVSLQVTCYLLYRFWDNDGKVWGMAGEVSCQGTSFNADDAVGMMVAYVPSGNIM